MGNLGIMEKNMEINVHIIGYRACLCSKYNQGTATPLTIVDGWEHACQTAKIDLMQKSMSAEMPPFVCT